jgi:hypothetical protein
MSYHWNGNNPIPTSEKLFNFLDPAATGEKIMDGSRIADGVACTGMTGCDVVGVESELLATEGWSLYPNPAGEWVVLQVPTGVEVAEVRLYDGQGRFVRRWGRTEVSAPLGVGDLVPGPYLVTVETTSGVTATQQLHVTGR